MLGIPFLGFVLFPTHRRLKGVNVHNFLRRLRRQIVSFRQQQLELAAVTRSTQAWLAHAAHGDTLRLRRQLLAQHKI